MAKDSVDASNTFTGSAHVLAVHDLAASKDFYERVLGFEDLQVAAPGWCFMQRDACRLHIGECPDAMPAGETGDHSYYAYFYVTGAADLFALARAEGAELVKPLQDESWGMREFALRTPDGHRIMIGEPIDATPS
ncbi:MAG: bleomycin resistance protein [Gammaproteobacteria bacterium]|nr:MAG: bleomycin resistance protein [Gammaproteobacteria bacterium]